VSRKRIAWLMRQRGVCRRGWVFTTVRDGRPDRHRI
jgi:hypothetical protein